MKRLLATMVGATLLAVTSVSTALAYGGSGIEFSNSPSAPVQVSGAVVTPDSGPNPGLAWICTPGIQTGKCEGGE